MKWDFFKASETNLFVLRTIICLQLSIYNYLKPHSLSKKTTTIPSGHKQFIDGMLSSTLMTETW